MAENQAYLGSGDVKEDLAVTSEPAAVICLEKDVCCETMNYFPGDQEQKETTIPIGKESPGSSMTTKELQEYWRNEKRRSREVKVLFEIPGANIVEKPFCKYVKYQIIIIQSGSFDSNVSVIERRYSDFEKLHTNLLKEFYDEMEDVAFPKKSLTGNFTDEIIAERKLAFQDYLRLLYSMEFVRFSPMFVDFLTRPELEKAYGCLRGGQYAQALEGLLGAAALQEKLAKHRPTLLVPTLCAIVVCHKDMEDFRSAFEFGEMALRRLEKHPGHRYCVPLLETMISLAYGLGQDFLSYQKEMEEKIARKRHHKTITLKELAVQEYIN